MTDRPKRPGSARPKRPASSPWPIRIVAAAAVLIVVGALVYTIATGTIFSVTGQR